MDRKKKESAKTEQHILVAGGRLQGTEIIYLAKKAGYYVTLIDKSPDAPASGLADRLITADLFAENQVLEAIQEADCVFPAIEDLNALRQLGKYCAKTGTRYIFDEQAYRISSSKQRTNRLLNEIGVSIPENFPQCGYPVICKPDASSGSRGVVKVQNENELRKLILEDKNTVIQQYLEGPVYSLEVLGDGKNAMFPLITEVVIDRKYDCKRIIAPAEIGRQTAQEFTDIAKKINTHLKINGIFDIEAILHEGKLYVLEIDARFPSQTPISIFHSAGINFVRTLAEDLPDAAVVSAEMKERRVCIYQQIAVDGSRLEVLGEHIMAGAGILQIVSGFCGSDEMITDYIPGKHSWRAIVILTGKNMREIEDKWKECLREIAVLQKCENMIYTEG